MTYYKITTSTPYENTQKDFYFSSSESLSEMELDNIAGEVTRKNAENFEYLLTGVNYEKINGKSKKQIEKELDDYYSECEFEYCEISHEEFIQKGCE